MIKYFNILISHGSQITPKDALSLVGPIQAYKSVASEI